MEKKKIAFVVLHYKTIDDTRKCVDSVKRIETVHSNFIIIVDNGSNDGSGEVLKKEYTEDTVIINKKNLGFASGNNVGFLYAKNTLNADFIIFLNNDTYIDQIEFSDNLVNKYNESHYYVCGPDILDYEYGHLNPGSMYTTTFMGMVHFRKIMKDELKRLRKNKTNISMERTVIKREYKNYDVEGCYLHGACLIFSPDYVNKYNGIYPHTFLYHEEDILKLQMQVYGHKMLYDHDIHIVHVGSSSTKKECPDSNEREIRRIKWQIKSTYEYNKVLFKLKFSPLFFIKWCIRKIRK